MGLLVLLDLFKKPIEFILYRLFLLSDQHTWKIRNHSTASLPPVRHLTMQNTSTTEKALISIVVIFIIGFQLPSPAYSFENISLKRYKTQAIKTDNPVDLTRLPLNKTFQVNSPDFVLQFFFSGPDVLGIIFKRNLDKALFVKWCFFRNCEESPFDYVSAIAQPHSPPLANGFFETKFPSRLSYHFQALHFYTRD